MTRVTRRHGPGSPEPGPTGPPRPAPTTAVDDDSDEGDDLARWLCRRLPEFTPTYLTLLDGCGDDPGDPVVLMGLADLVSATLTLLERQRRLLDRALGAVEDHLEAVGDDSVDSDVVAFAFFDSLAPEDRRLLAPHLGPRSTVLADRLDLPDAPWDG
jgi:hypothetical protein